MVYMVYMFYNIWLVVTGIWIDFPIILGME